MQAMKFKAENEAAKALPGLVVGIGVRVSAPGSTCSPSQPHLPELFMT
jgi:hypothetical protein